jgi:WD40 repeat protein/class 3 adenylate cyclase/tRNA A-37 threonylcarbamoyl transferase component Bud32
MVSLSTPATEGGSPVQPARHQTGLMTMLFTDLVGSTALKEAVGDRAGASLTQQHHGLVRELLGGFKGGEEIGTAGDSFLIVFARPSDAVHFGLLLHARLRAMNQGSAARLEDRIGIHVGEVVIWEQGGSPNPKGLTGIQVDTCARVMGLAQGGQILLTRSAFDSARQMLKGEDIQGVGPLEWLNHGPYSLKGIEAPVEVCEVGEVGIAPLHAPAGSEKAQRQVTPESEPVLGWRPAVGQLVPNTRWRLETKLGEGGFGEVWLGRNSTTKERRVFKFCFQVERVRFLKRELTLFRLLKERVGEHPNIVRLQDVYLDQPPFYVEMDYVEGADLRSWAAEHGGVEAIPLATRLEIVAQAADGLQAAHEAGIIHRDIKPANILIGGRGIEPTEVRVKLTDFGIGQVVSDEYLSGITRAGFTQTMMSDSSTSHTGTQLYVAPELLAGKPASTRSDIYSLGVVLYQLLVGDFSRPVATDWANDISDALLRDDLKHCFAGHPQDRFAGAGQLARHLRALPERKAELERAESLQKRAQWRRRVALVSSGVAVPLILIAVALAYGLRKAQTERDVQRRYAYAADVNLAHQALEEENLGRALELLERHRPSPGEKDIRGWEWRYLWRLCRSDESFSLPGHSNMVSVVAFSPDGKLLASGGHDGKIKLWDLATRHEAAVLTHGNVVRSLAWSPDGKVLATGASDGAVRLWEVLTRKEIRSFPSIQDTHDGAVAFSPDGHVLATGGKSGKISLWDWGHNSLIVTLPGHSPGPVGALVFSPDGKTLASASGWGYDPAIWLWDIDARRARKKLSVNARYVHSLAYSPDGKLLASGNWDKTVSLWNAATLERLPDLAGYNAWVSSVAFSPDGKILATASADQTVRLWEVGTWRLTATLKGHLYEVQTLAFSPDGKSLATGSKDGGVKLWSAAQNRGETTRLPLPTNLAYRRFSPDGHAFVTMTRDGTITLWDPASLREQATFQVSISNVADLALSPQKDRLLALGGQDGNISLFDVASKTVAAVLQGHVGAVVDLAFSPDGKILATVGDDRTLKLWDVAERRERATLEHKMDPAWSRLCFSSAGDILGAPLGDFTVILWDIAKGQRLGVLQGHKAEVIAVAFSPAEKWVATASNDGTAKLWDLKTRKLLRSYKGQLLGLTGVSISPDKRRLVGGAGEGTLKFWDIDTSQEVLTLKGHSYFPGCVFFLDSDTIVSSSRDDVIVWRSASLAEIEAAEEGKSKAP